MYIRSFSSLYEITSSTRNFSERCPRINLAICSGLNSKKTFQIFLASTVCCLHVSAKMKIEFMEMANSLAQLPNRRTVILLWINSCILYQKLTIHRLEFVDASQRFLIGIGRRPDILPVLFPSVFFHTSETTANFIMYIFK